MNVCYGPLAAQYDALTGDVPYEELTDWYETAFASRGRAVRTVLDLCCGTGTVSLLLAQRGYELISADASAEMLSVFQQKLWELPEGTVRPMLLCQRAEELDLYDTVDAAVCSLDSMNYLPPEILPEVFRRLHLFISPDGTLCFDYLAPSHMRSLNGQTFVDEKDGLLCLWRAAVEENELHYGMDIFRERKNGLWEREQEEHTEYIHEPERLKELLTEAGFGDIEFCGSGPQNGQGRRFVVCRCVK